MKKFFCLFLGILLALGSVSALASDELAFAPYDETVAVTIGRESFDLGPVRESVAFLKEGKTAYEFRTTVVRELHDEASFRGIGAWIDGAERYALQHFTDRDTVPFEGFHTPEEAEMAKWAQAMKPHVREVILR